MTEKPKREFFDRKFFSTCFSASTYSFGESIVETIELARKEPVTFFFAILKSKSLDKTDKLPLFAFLEPQLERYLSEDPIQLTPYERKRVEAMHRVCERKKADYTSILYL